MGKKSAKNRYSEKELMEFEELIKDKLGKARIELNFIKETLSRRNDTGTEALKFEE